MREGKRENGGNANERERENEYSLKGIFSLVMNKK